MTLREKRSIINIEMPVRKNLLVNYEVYHVFNRGNGSIPIFKNVFDHQKFLQTILYYQNSNPPLRLSKFNSLTPSERESYLRKLKQEKNYLVEIIAYCLMPNHFHLLLKQLKDEGIKNFLRLISDSHSRYFNTKYTRKGSLFEGRFKALRVENDSQLLHLSRYIHLNPYSSFLVKDLKDLFKYPYSSLKEYLNYTNTSVCNKEIILSQFKSTKDYHQFILDQTDYQRTLDTIKHQSLE